MKSNPYAYQPEIIQELRDGFKAGHVRQILSASTGAGKSVVMMEMVKLAVEKGKRVLFMCERRNLNLQFSGHLDRAGIDHGIIMDDSPKYNPSALVQVACIQSIERRKSLEFFDIMFLDEVHMMMRKSVIALMESRPKMKVIGATATPFHKLLGIYFTNTASAPPMAELIELGTLVPFVVFGAVQIDTNGVKVKGGEWDKEELGERGKLIVGDVVTDYMRLSQQVFGRNSKAICFSASISHGAELVNAFAAQGINAIQLASGVEAEFKSDVLLEFSKPESTIDVLISVDMLSRGFDQTDIEHVILAKPIKKSLSNHVQMMGRGARKHENKTRCLIQDHGGNWLRFEDDFYEFFHKGAESLIGKADKKEKKEPTEKKKKESVCPSCGAYWPARSDTCVNCGHTRVRRNEIINKPGEMLELTSPSKKKDKEFTFEIKQDWYSQFNYLENTWNVKKSWSYAMFINKFGHKPHGYSKDSKPATDEVKNWCKSAIMRYKFSKAKNEHRV